MITPNHPPGTPVCLYLRRSHDKHQEESLDTQRRSAREYCAARGWIIVEEFVDGLDRRASRAEFVKRPGLIKMLNHAKLKKFELVVLRDETRLGGDMTHTGLIMQDLADHGVGVVYYISDELVATAGATAKLMVTLRNFASELEREKISSRTHEHLMQKAKDGKPAGGIAFGYAIENGAYVVKASEARTVRRIFKEYAAGLGLRAVASKLNKDQVPNPRQGRRGGSSWMPSTVRAILGNTRYMGEGRYNQRHSTYRGGTKVIDRRPASEHVTYACPAIVERSAWDAVQRRLASNPRFGEAVSSKGATPKHLLSGISQCAACGGPITVKKHTAKSEARSYLCSRRRDRGAAVCSCARQELCEQVDLRVLAKVRELIAQDILSDVVREVYAMHAEQRATMPAERERLQGAVDTLKREIGRLTAALATTDSPPPSLLQALAERDARLRQAELDLSAASATAETIDKTLAGIELSARRILKDLRAQLQHPATARQALVALTDGEKLVFKEAPRGGFRVEGAVNMLALVAPDCDKTRPRFDTVRQATRLAFVA